MSFHFVSHPWQVRELADGTLVKITPPDLEGLANSGLAEELLDLGLESGQPNLYLDFEEVRLLARIVVDKLLSLQQRLREAGARLILCNLGPDACLSFQSAGADGKFEVRLATP